MLHTCVCTIWDQPDDVLVPRVLILYSRLLNVRRARAILFGCHTNPQGNTYPTYTSQILKMAHSRDKSETEKEKKIERMKSFSCRIYSSSTLKTESNLGLAITRQSASSIRSYTSSAKRSIPTNRSFDSWKVKITLKDRRSTTMQ